MLNKLKARIEQVRDAAELKAAEMLPDDWKVPDSVAEERFAVCNSCEHLYHLTHTCKKCGCFMKLKTTLAKASCPIDKWGKWTDPNKTE